MEEWFMLNCLWRQFIQYFFPIKRSHFTSLLIKEYHQKLFHSGVSHKLRNEYCIPQGRAEVKKAIHGCGTCKIFQGGPFKLPSMSPWLRKKVAKSAPFTYTGLDYFGPLYIQAENSKEKSLGMSFHLCRCQGYPLGTDQEHDS